MVNKFFSILLPCMSMALSQTASATGCSHPMSYTNLTNQDTTWMSSIKDSTVLSDISIIGTHDSMTDGVPQITGAGYVKTQEWNLMDQLNHGVRFFDFRVVADGRCSEAMFYHGSQKVSDTNLVEAVSLMARWLSDHPAEVLIVRVRSEADLPDYIDTTEYIAEVRRRVSRAFFQPGVSLYTNASANPTLGEVRGMIVTLDDNVGGGALPSLSYRETNRYDLWDPHNAGNCGTINSCSDIKMHATNGVIAAISNADNHRLDRLNITYISASTSSRSVYITPAEYASSRNGLGEKYPNWANSWASASITPPDGRKERNFGTVVFDFVNYSHWNTQQLMRQNEREYQDTCKEWSNSATGNVGDVYMYDNQHAGGMREYFKLLKPTYGYFPIDHKGNDTWQYLGTWPVCRQ